MKHVSKHFMTIKHFRVLTFIRYCLIVLYCTYENSIPNSLFYLNFAKKIWTYFIKNIRLISFEIRGNEIR